MQPQNNETNDVPETPTVHTSSPIAKQSRNTLIAAGVVTVATCVLYAWKFHGQGFSGNPEQWGQLGEYFGGILGPAFGLISIYLLLATMQLQRQQVEDTKSDLKESRNLATDQHLEAKKQTFEQAFFSWIHSYRDLVNIASFTEYTGRLALSKAWMTFMHPHAVTEFLSREDGSKFTTLYNMLSMNEPIPSVHTMEVSQAAIASFQELYSKFPQNVDAVFRTLYRLIKWIDEQPSMPWSEKFQYVAIVRAQLSSIELSYLFYNGLTVRGTKFVPLINKYALFDNFDADDCVIDAARIAGGQAPDRYTDCAFDSDVARSHHALFHAKEC